MARVEHTRLPGQPLESASQHVVRSHQLQAQGGSQGSCKRTARGESWTSLTVTTLPQGFSAFKERQKSQK